MAFRPSDISAGWRQRAAECGFERSDALASRALPEAVFIHCAEMRTSIVEAAGFREIYLKDIGVYRLLMAAEPAP